MTPLNRRRWLAASLVAAAASAPAMASDTGDVMRVRMEMEVTGNAHLAENPIASREVDLRLPIESTTVLDYEEASADGRTRRYYHTAGSDTTLNRSRTAIRLRDDVRRCTVDDDAMPERVSADEDYLTGDEADLLVTPLSSVHVDGLLPRRLFDGGGRPKLRSMSYPTTDAIARAFNLTAVDKSDLSVEVVAVEKDEMKFAMRGKIDGSVGGVATSLEVVGKLTLDRDRNTCTWAAASIRERRHVGVARPGFDVRATVKMLRQPMEDSMLGRDDADRPAGSDATVGSSLVHVTSRSLGVTTLLDRRWHLMSDVAGAAVVRLADSDRAVAQIDLRRPPALPDGRSWTIGDLESDVRNRLDGQIRDIVARREYRTENGLEVASVTAAGEVDGVGVRWVVMHLTDDTGRRAVATFTMDAASVSDFAGHDEQFAAMFRFLDPADGDGVAAGKSRETVRVSGKPARPQLESASDRR